MTPTFIPLVDAIATAYRDSNPSAAARQREPGNAAMVEQFYRAVTRGDYEGVRACLAPDVTFEHFGLLPLPSPEATGLAQVMAAIQANFGSVVSERAELLSLIVQGDAAMLAVRDRGKIKATGEPYRCDFIVEFRFVAGLITRGRQWVISGK